MKVVVTLIGIWTFGTSFLSRYHLLTIQTILLFL